MAPENEGAISLLSEAGNAATDARPIEEQFLMHYSNIGSHSLQFPSSNR